MAGTDGHAHMRRPAAHGFEKQQVPRLHLVEIHGVAGTILVAHLAGKHRSKLGKHVLHEAAAIKPGRVAAPISIGHTPKSEGCRNEG